MPTTTGADAFHIVQLLHSCVPHWTVLASPVIGVGPFVPRASPKVHCDRSSEAQSAVAVTSVHPVKVIGPWEPSSVRPTIDLSNDASRRRHGNLHNRSGKPLVGSSLWP